MLQLAGTLLLLTSWTQDASISGRVTDHQDRPLANAIVTVFACHPKSGPIRQNPSSYEECKKTVRTQEDGSFEITGLNSTLQYSLAISAQGFKGTITKYADAENLKTFSLQPLTNVDKDTQNIRGRIMDAKGQPISGAVLRMLSANYPDGGSTVEPSVPAVTLTNEKGQFDFEVGGYITSILFQAYAPGLAVEQFTWNQQKDSPIAIKLDRGGAITGQLTFHGKPIIAKIGLSNSMVSQQEVTTDATGHFRLTQLPPNDTCTIYTLLDQDIGAGLPVTIVESPGNGKLADYGTIELQPASAVRIKLVTNDGRPLPAKGRIIIGRENAYHSLVMNIPDGSPNASVAATCVAEEELRIFIQLPDCEVVEVTPKCPMDQQKAYLLSTEKSRDITFTVKLK